MSKLAAVQAVVEEVPGDGCTVELRIDEPPRPKLVYTVSSARRRWWGSRRSFWVLEEHIPSKYSYTLVHILARGWMKPTEFRQLQGAL